MTNIELLRLCLEAFEAAPIAADSRKLLKRLGVAPTAYAGNGSEILARYMTKLIHQHLDSLGI
jgi:hypothetical protein